PGPGGLVNFHLTYEAWKGFRMKASSAISRLFPVALFLLGAGAARADMIDFSYSWSVDPGSVLVGTNPANVTGNGLSSGSVAIATAADGASSAVLGGGQAVIPTATVTTTGSAPPDAPDSFATPFSLKLHLTDTASGNAGDLTFAGK